MLRTLSKQAILKTRFNTSNTSAIPNLFIRSLATSAPVIPKTQKAIVFTNYKDPLEYKDIPVPTPGPNEILVNIKYSGVCNSDYHLWRDDWHLPLVLSPLVLGHEGAGVVVAKGDNVTNFEIGDNAGIKWVYSTCQSCDYCENSHESVCPSQLNAGYSAQGTYQQYAVADAVQAAKIPQGVDLAKVAPLLCAGITVYKALKEAHLKAGDWVTIIGAGGGLGSLAVQFAKVLGLKIIAVDGSDKKDYVLSKGVKEFVAFDEVESVPERILEITKGGCHAVLNVSNSVKAYNDATTYVRPRGTVLLVGLPADGAKIESDILSHTLRCINLKGSCVGNRADTAEALQFFADGLIDSNVKIVGLSEAPEVFKLMEQRKILGRYVLDTSR